MDVYLAQVWMKSIVCIALANLRDSHRVIRWDIGITPKGSDRIIWCKHICMVAEPVDGHRI